MRQSTAQLDVHLDELDGELPTIGRRLVAALAKAEFPVQHVRRGRGRRGIAPWLFHIKPADHLRESFGLAPELLLLLLPAREAFARDISQAEKTVDKKLRLDKSLVVVVAKDQTAGERLRPITMPTGREYLFVDLEALTQQDDPRPWLRTELRRQLGAADLFAPNRPVTGWDFFGRDVELKLLRQHLSVGKPVGLYGLRKTGKTSLALRCLDRLAREGRTLGLHIDLQVLARPDRNYTGFMRQLLRSIAEAHKRQSLQEELEFDERGFHAKQLRKLDDKEVQEFALATVEGAIEWTQREPVGRVVLFIDEYERLFESDLFPPADARDILDYLRGLVQTYPGYFDFVIAGLTRGQAAQPRLGSSQNPLYGFTVDFPLAGLERDRLNEMIRKIGRRVGLSFEPEALDLIAAKSGGHPALARQFGRLIDRRVNLEQRAQGHRVTQAELSELLEAYAVEVEPTMEEIYRAVDGIDPQIPRALAMLADDPRALDALTTQSREQLRKLGVIEALEGGERVAIGAFADWLGLNVGTTRAVGS